MAGCRVMYLRSARTRTKRPETMAEQEWQSKNNVPLLPAALLCNRLKGLAPLHSCPLRMRSISKNLCKGTKRCIGSYNFKKKHDEKHSNQPFLG